MCRNEIFYYQLYFGFGSDKFSLRCFFSIRLLKFLAITHEYVSKAQFIFIIAFHKTLSEKTFCPVFIQSNNINKEMR